MILLIATIFPPVIVAALRRFKRKLNTWSVLSPTCKWAEDSGKDGSFWHAIGLILMITKITLAVVFIYSLQYRESNLARSIVNRPKISTALTIIFYMCSECMLAAGFAGVMRDAGGEKYVLPAQYIGALFMIFLAFYSEGYIIEYKSHDPAHWPTEGMTKWNAFCYWCKRASKITNHNLRSLFTTDLRRDLLLCIQKNEHFMYVLVLYVCMFVFVCVFVVLYLLLGNIMEIIQKMTAKSKSDFKLTHTEAQNNQNDKLGKLIVMKRHKYRFIIIPSMVTMWSDCSPQTKYVWHWTYGN
ncbi:Tpr-related protein family member, putative [Theileria annulata]|uniref:Tpr-related protein family member, putative n=1 Tax=Theileria annulata TaxID=5874 RepID=Q4UBM0_THEAN|nr:Tpr-related protein family member, putative [Theileria annulata]CAI75781.1 Tpr-related protein family member, putative [Theileria annulata]|eukprot:XP_955257.1 Tpr-related protein family member, putative [Theileria annulata]